ncbi:MAG: hypothetical protein IJP82_01945 [Bacteroidaceae bacterium]|nr:hypothetical protein [Bacteroidaceae bacterium]
MRKILLTLTLVLVASVAFGKKKPKTENIYGKGKGIVYVFGVGQMLTDSVVYITTIQALDSIDLEPKTGFLPYRSELSLQLKEYLEGTEHLKHQTTCMFYAAKRKKLSKQYYKIKKRYLDNPETKLFMIDDQRFQFRHPLDAYIVHEGDQQSEKE